MYKKFKKLLESKNITPYQVAKDTGIAQSTLSDWKLGKTQPKVDKLVKIADYFHVSIDFLVADNTSISRKED